MQNTPNHVGEPPALQHPQAYMHTGTSSAKTPGSSPALTTTATLGTHTPVGRARRRQRGWQRCTHSAPAGTAHWRVARAGRTPLAQPPDTTASET